MINDPIERIVADGLGRAKIRYIHESHHGGPPLDFYLPDYDIYLEVKQLHSDRIAKQMAQVPNIIAIQGRAAAVAFCAMLPTP